MRRFALSFVSLGSLLLVGCAHPQQAYRFPVVSKSDEPVLEKVARTLAAQGQQVTSVDPNAGVVYTRWQDTGFMYGQIQNAAANIVRRYVITWAPGKEGGEMQVRQESQRCAQGMFSIGDAGLQGACQLMDGVVPKHQEDLDTLGRELQGALR